MFIDICNAFAPGGSACEIYFLARGANLLESIWHAERVRMNRTIRGGRTDVAQPERRKCSL
jgi:hypothetical protein